MNFEPGIVAGTAADELAFIEETLAAPVVSAIVRIWLYTRPAVVLGCAQRPDDAMRARAAAAGFDLVVRPSGGGAVLAGAWMLASTVILPPRHARVDVRIRESFRWFGLAHEAVLRRAGIEAAAVADVSPAANDDPLAWACFSRLSWWEVQSAGRKLVGLAQARRRHGVVLSSGVLIADQPWEGLCDVLARPRADAAALRARTIACEDLSRVPAAAIAPALASALRAELQGQM
ncbi:MAG TPA: ligase [Burkholderiaceae bacterium]|nr:ligase [Burkholderiaceae bacterium]